MTVALLLAALTAMAEERTVASPDGKLVVTVADNGGLLTYSATLDGRQMMTVSRLGLETDFADFTQGLTVEHVEETAVSHTYSMRQTKQSASTYVARRMLLDVKNRKGQQMQVCLDVSDNNVAFRYHLPRPEGKDTKVARVLREVSAFNFPAETRTFLCPQITPMTGWQRTKPSYEEDYKVEQPMNVRSQYGQGYTFPCLFRVGGEGWALVSETGVDAGYVGSHLSDYNPQTGYTIAFPQPGENNGNGTVTAGIPLPYDTPWRTITLGSTPKPIVETTIAYDLVAPKYAPSEEYKGGRYTWSWLIWQDESINYADQKQFVDLAAAMGYEYCLVDNWWDERIGRQRIAFLSDYARQKGVSLMLWYNSNGAENDAPQTPRDCMSEPIRRQSEMAWMQRIGVKGIKVDFFGGDKQQTMKLYEDILVDANRYGLQVIFHGCTLPRGWEVMYPNYVASEAVLASENVYFSEGHARTEAFELTLHPFCRNAVGTMDWGGTMMNKYLSRDNRSRHRRYTTDIFEMAAAIVNQTAVQCIAIQPNNLEELPAFELDFLKTVPTTWDEVRFIDGYPGRYVVLARRHGNDWYVAGLNAGREARAVTVIMPEWAGKSVGCYVDDARKGPQLRPLKFNKQGVAKVTMLPDGGLILKGGF